jgi:hypothetical protein
MGTKYPQVKVRLIGGSGNAFAVLGATIKAMKRAGLSQEQVDEYKKEATAGDYDHLLATTMNFVEVS